MTSQRAFFPAGDVLQRPPQKCTRHYIDFTTEEGRGSRGMAAGDDDLVMVVFLALTLVEDYLSKLRP